MPVEAHKCIFRWVVQAAVQGEYTTLVPLKRNLTGIPREMESIDYLVRIIRAKFAISGLEKPICCVP